MGASLGTSEVGHLGDDGDVQGYVIPKLISRCSLQVRPDGARAMRCRSERQAGDGSASETCWMVRELHILSTCCCCCTISPLSRFRGVSVRCNAHTRRRCHIVARDVKKCRNDKVTT